MIECYCDFPSYRAGDAVDVHVNTSSASFDVEVLDGTRGRIPVWSAKAVAGAQHEIPADAAANGCGWPVTFSIPTTSEWESAAYIIVLTAADGSRGEGLFVLRPVTRKASILFVVALSTYQAYNDYGGANTYSKGGAAYNGGIPVVSWRRPLPPGFVVKSDDFVKLANVTPGSEAVPFIDWAVGHGVSTWTGSAGWTNWEEPFVEWARAEGYSFDFACSHDLHSDPATLDGYTMMLSVGHDEYWSWEMRDCVERFVETGGNVAFLSGNTAFWQVRFDDAFSMTAYKGKWRDDPLYGTADQSRVSGIWSNPITGRPENQLTGVSFVAAGYARLAGASPQGTGGFTIYRPEHWVFEGTNLRYGDLLGRESVLVGYEVDGCRFQFRHGRPEATGEDGTPASFQILGIAPAALFSKTSAPDLYPDGTMSDLEVVADQMTGGFGPENCAPFEYGHATMGVFERGGTVFTAATTEWASCVAGGDQQVITMTRNLIDRLGRSA